MRLKNTLIIAAIIAIASTSTLAAQSSLIEQEAAAVVQQEFDNELRTPLVGPKLRNYVREYMKTVAENLYRANYEVETMRNGEVVIVTIPTDNLFQPNEATIIKLADKYLSTFRQYATPNGRFKIVLAVHCDDTGSEEYGYTLTEQRINSLLDYFVAAGFDPESLVGFAKGASEPLVDSVSRINRARNRRLEIFIIPSEELLSQARSQNK